MIITLDIKPETERRLRRKAEHEGQEFSRYLELLLNKIAEESEATESDKNAANDLR